MKTIYETTDLGTTIKLEQMGVDAFRVTYGLQVKSRLTYEQAAHELGECIFHALACEGKLDNRTKEDVQEENAYNAYFDKCEAANKIPLDFGAWRKQNA